MNESFDVIEQQKEKESVTSNDQIDYCCEPVPEISPNISIDSPLENEKIFNKSPRELVCYCDGSYSHQSQIGYSGFRASNEFSKYRCCFPRRPRSGSTESEVFAACLALQYVAEYHYDTLILYTDSSKVKQLCEGPKRNDHNNYPTFIQVLNECREMNNQFDLRVEQVCGHPTWFEQQQCPIKREFAKVDRKVRRKRQQYERRYHFKKSYHRPLFDVLSLSISSKID